MIKHVVLLKFKEALTDKQLLILQQGFTDLASQIDEIQRYEFGPDLSFYRGNADYALVAEFLSQADVEIYVQHPLHQAFLKNVAGPILASFMSAQFSL